MAAGIITLPKWLRENLDNSPDWAIPERTGKYEIGHNVADGYFYFKLKASNGEVILESQQYASRQACITGIRSVQLNGPLEERYRRDDAAAKWSFKLCAANGETIGLSQQYTTSSARERGIASVKTNASTSRIEDVINN